MTTIITAIEMGPMESCVALMAESLRKWGGDHYGNARILGIKPRFGPQISRNIKTALMQYDVELIDYSPDCPFS